MGQDGVNAARVFMGDSLGFHIIFVMFSLTLPVLVSWFEMMGIRKKDPKLTNIAKFWSKIMTVIVITGVISGTIIALQMSLVWPGILKFGGEVIGLPFLFETYAFLVEAVFLALYMATWNSKKVSAIAHWIFGLFIILGSTMSAFVITSVNGWMNKPTGFDYVDGKIVNIDVWAAMFSRTSLIEFFHSMPGYYLSVSLLIAGFYAMKILHAKVKDRLSGKYKYDWVVVQKLMIFAVVSFVAVAIMGDVSAKYLAVHEPSKLAAMELNYVTRSNAPLTIGGVGNTDGTVSGPHVQIPGGLSFLSGYSNDTVVKGLNDYPKSEYPPLYVHVIFDIKLVLIGLITAYLALYFAVKIFKPKQIHKSWFLLPLTVVGFIATIVMELGWMLTEIGRQPWSVRGYVTTTEALTKTHDITSFGYFFPASYVVLFAVTLLAVRKLVAAQSKTEGREK